MPHELNITPITDWFIHHPLTKVGVRELARLTKSSPATTLRQLKELKKQGIVTLEGGQYDADTTSTLYIALKQAHNLFVLRTSNCIQDIAKSSKPDAIVVFGSYVRGEDHEESDLDIAIINPRSKGLLPARIGHRKASYHYIHWKNISPELRTSIANGITLYGTLVIS